MKKRFATFLISGKAATLPMLLQEAMANNGPVTPSYTDITTGVLTLVELPQAGKFQLESTAYGVVPTICVNAGATAMSTVVTGVQRGDQVFIAASSDKDDPAFLALNSQLRVGQQNFTLLAQFRHDGTDLAAPVGATTSTSTASITFSINLTELASRGLVGIKGTKFYLQAMVWPKSADGSDWSQFRYSELDEITVDSCTAP
ncbi:hypothetical protein QWZ03_11375 [Chitinimonas viridis]|nr:MULTISPECIES: hypothetical protein [Chitinimonas]MDN3577366.1 hypothetical protein [Chitinimonas viridis]